MSKSKLFQVKDATERRSLVHKVRVNEAEDEEIRHLAAIRQLDLSEYHRRTALGRSTNVDYDTDVVVQLSALTRVMRDYHAALVERNLPTPDDILRPVMEEILNTLLKIQGK